jgi:hypothetical protein
VSRAIPSANLQECGVTGSPIDNSETKRALAQDMNSDRYVVKSCGVQLNVQLSIRMSVVMMN